MKSSLKQQENSAASVQTGVAQTGTDQPLTDQPFNSLHPLLTSPLLSAAPRLTSAEPFREFLRSRLPREKASPALLHKIRQITKSPL